MITLRAVLTCSLATLILGSPNAQATNSCRPTVTVQADTPIQLPDTGLPLYLAAKLADPLPLSSSAAHLGLAGRSGKLTLDTPLELSGETIPLGQLESRVSEVGLQAAEGTSVTLSSGQQHYLLYVHDGKLVNKDGSILRLFHNKTSNASFSVAAGSDIVIDAQGKVVLEAGSRIKWRLDNSTAQVFAIRDAITLETTNKTNTAIRMQFDSGDKVPVGGAITVSLRAANIDFRLLPLTFCIASEHLITNVRGHFEDQSGETARFTLIIPNGQHAAFESFSERLVGKPFTLHAFGKFNDTTAVDVTAAGTLTSRLVSAILGIVMLVVLFLLGALVASTGPVTMLQQLLNNRSGKCSLSNLQILGWTAVILFAMFYITATTGVLMGITTDMLALLGISGTTSILARAADNQSPATTLPAGTPYLTDLLRSGDGQFDLLRFQMLAFTIFTWAYTITSILGSKGFPEIPSNLYLLMGVSGGTYVLGKVTPMLSAPQPTPPFSVTQLQEVQKALGISSSEVMNSATEEAIIRYKRAQGIRPATGDIDQRLLDHLHNRPS